MAKMKRNYEVKNAFENIENSGRKRKSVFGRLMEAIKMLSENDAEAGSVDENEVRIFNENLSSISEVENNNYKDSLQYNSLQQNKEIRENDRARSSYYNDYRKTNVKNNDIEDIQK